MSEESRPERKFVTGMEAKIPGGTNTGVNGIEAKMTVTWNGQPMEFRDGAWRVAAPKDDADESAEEKK